MDKLLTPAEAAQMLKVTRRTIYRWIDDGTINAFKIKRTVRISADEVERIKAGEDIGK